MRKEYFEHLHALVDRGVHIGSGTRIWAFAHVLPGAVIGSECNICDHTFIEGGVTIGDRVTVKCGVYLWKGVRIEDDVFVGPCVAFTNDLRPRSRQQPPKYATTLLRDGCSIGANATILPVSIGRYAMIGAGSVVTRDVPDYALVAGSPARFRSWLCRCGQKLDSFSRAIACCDCGRAYYLAGNQQIEEIHESRHLHIDRTP